jgi:hypothetical protein
VWDSLTDAQKDELFAEDIYLQGRLNTIYESSISYPSESVDKDAPTMDGTTRGLLQMLETGLIT